MMNNCQFLIYFLVFCLVFEEVHNCPSLCTCGDDEPKSCSPGVSLIIDGCGCCRICAKQLNQPCNDETHLCDPHKRLYCDYTQTISAKWGICKAQRGRSCVHGGLLVVSGTSVSTSCKGSCQCIDGAIGCEVKCPHESQPPPAKLCPRPRLQSVEGQCCDEWVCGSTSDILPPNSQHVDDPLEENISYSVEDATLLTNKADDNVIYESDGGADGDELVEQGMSYYYSSNNDENISNDWEQSNQIPGNDNDLTWEESIGGVNNWPIFADRLNECPEKTSEWSSCSKSCGLGLSTRVSNQNQECQLRRESRLCLIRECESSTQQSGGKRCKDRLSKKRILLDYVGCKTIKSFRPRICGSCPNSNRCCVPRTTRTTKFRFRCRDGRFFYKNFMEIRSCHCQRQECDSKSSTFLTQS